MSAAAILKLQTVGFTLEQVAALADLVDLQAASKTDLAEAKHELEQKIDSVSAEVVAAEHRLEQRIDGVKLDIATVKLELGQKISETQVGTQRFILTAFLSTVALNAVVILGAMFGLAKLLGH